MECGHLGRTGAHAQLVVAEGKGAELENAIILLQHTTVQNAVVHQYNSSAAIHNHVNIHVLRTKSTVTVRIRVVHPARHCNAMHNAQSLNIVLVVVFVRREWSSIVTGTALNQNFVNACMRVVLWYQGTLFMSLRNAKNGKEFV